MFISCRTERLTDSSRLVVMFACKLVQQGGNAFVMKTEKLFLLVPGKELMTVFFFFYKGHTHMNIVIVVKHGSPV